MVDTTSGVVTHRTVIYSKSKAFSITAHIARVLLGLIFLGFGLNGFLHFIPMPPPTGPQADFYSDCFVSLLTNCGHEGEILNPTGASSITFKEAAAIISNGIEKPVNYIPISIEAVGEALRSMGAGEWNAKLMMDYSRAYSKGWGDYTNNDVEIITGHKPRSFQQFFDEVMSWGFKQRVKSNQDLVMA